MKVLIIGGTGTLGGELVKRYYADHSVTVFSRDELKQQNMKKEYPKVKYIIGDIKDRDSIGPAIQGMSRVYHVAALKHVELGEIHTEEFIKTNLLGTINVAKACINYKVPKLSFCSTDKAVLPINAYGFSKGLAEKYLYSLDQKQTVINVFRWGNVIGSRGSAIHYFIECLKNGSIINITHEEMTRFWILIEDAVQFMSFTTDTFKHSPKEAHIPQMKACSILFLINVLAEMLGVKIYETKTIGIRPGEKIHECLKSTHDTCIRSDSAEQFTRDELKIMLKEFVL